MISELPKHLDGCSPVNPCRSCRAMEYLRRHLSDEQMEEFVGIITTGYGTSAHQSEYLHSRLQESIEELGMPTRAFGGLKGAGIRTIGELVVKRDTELLHIPNFGRRSLSDVKEALMQMGLHLGMKV